MYIADILTLFSGEGIKFTDLSDVKLIILENNYLSKDARGP